MKLFFAATILLFSVFGSTEYDDAFLANAKNIIEGEFVMPMNKEQIKAFAEKYHTELLETKNKDNENYLNQAQQILDQTENVLLNINQPELNRAYMSGLLNLGQLLFENNAREIPSVETITQNVEQEQIIMIECKEMVLKFFEVEQIKDSLEKDIARKELMDHRLSSIFPQGPEMNFPIAGLLIFLKGYNTNIERMKMYVSDDILTI